MDNDDVIMTILAIMSGYILVSIFDYQLDKVLFN